MPEGDTIARAAASLREWLVGREISAVDARDVAVAQRAEKLVGQRVDAVDARAKHLLITVGDLVVHSHMRITGSWHVYSRGDRWRYRHDAMRLVLEAGDRQAVCFNAPVVRVLPRRELATIPGLATLGPDILTGLDPATAAARFDAVDPATPMGDALLDQRVISGLGNIWRCETLWAQRVHPRTPVGAVDRSTREALVRTAAGLMQASVAPGNHRPRAEVYKRSGRPCGRCGTAIVSERMGRDNRTAYWCPNCQRPRSGINPVGDSHVFATDR
ncbi:MAG TPA: DNA-formamidopyrimidine glycosylase family protein [Acidimicrobiales bacterium]|nr:DNA-formamidopyrimidine glycosylase family protein [Acidimicrobiales bacterium]